MVRRIYILPEKSVINEAVENYATSNRCAEISLGVPSDLIGIVSQEDLPVVYEYPESKPLRRIYIIPVSMEVEDAIEDAKANNCPEIVHGIPSALKDAVFEEQLPTVYEEPESKPEPPIDLGAKMADLEVRIEKLESK